MGVLEHGLVRQRGVMNRWQLNVCIARAVALFALDIVVGRVLMRIPPGRSRGEVPVLGNGVAGKAGTLRVVRIYQICIGVRMLRLRPMSVFLAVTVPTGRLLG